MDVQQISSPDELEAVRAAVAEAETRSGGEIVAYVVARSDSYEEASYKAAVGGAVLSALAAGLAHGLGGLWGGWGVVWITLPALLGAALGWGLGTWWPALGRWLVDPETLELRVARRAAVAFVEEEVFATRERTGILIFLSLFEHRVEVLADAGIHARAEGAVWKSLADELAAGIRAGRAGQALIEAVERCGRLLEEGGVERREDDPDELSDEVRLRDV